MICIQRSKRFSYALLWYEARVNHHTCAYIHRRCTLQKPAHMKHHYVLSCKTCCAQPFPLLLSTLFFVFCCCCLYCSCSLQIMFVALIWYWGGVPWLRQSLPVPHWRGPGSIPEQSMWDLNLMKWHWDRLFSEYLLHFSVSIILLIYV